MKTCRKIIPLLACLCLLMGLTITASAETAAEFEQAKAQAAAAGVVIPETDANGLPVFVDTGFHLGERTFDIKEVSGTTPGGVYVYGDWTDNYYYWQLAMLDAAIDASGVTNEMSQYEKCVKYAQYVADSLEYRDLNDVNRREYEWPTLYDGLMALYYGHGVCENYADLFRIMCERTGINCDTVSGRSRNQSFAGAPSMSHAWNEVLADGKTYYVDVTWLDTGRRSQEYLMSETEWESHTREYRKQEVHFEEDEWNESNHLRIMSYGQQDTPVLREAVIAANEEQTPDDFVAQNQAELDALMSGINSILSEMVKNGDIWGCSSNYQ